MAGRLISLRPPQPPLVSAALHGARMDLDPMSDMECSNSDREEENVPACEDAEKGGDENCVLPYDTSDVFHCDGCPLTSSDNCPVGLKQGKCVICKWGKTRKVVKDNIKMKKPQGSWCSICLSLFKLRFKKIWKLKKMSGLRKKFKEDKANKKRWKSSYKEYCHLRAGGNSRVKKMKEIVYKDEEVYDDLEDPEKELWELDAYKEEFGDPKKNGARVVKMKNRKGKIVRGVVVLKGRKGVYAIKSGRRIIGKTSQVRDPGDVVLDEEQLEEAAAEVAEEMGAEVDVRGALTAEETQSRAEAQRAASLEAAGAAQAEAADGGKVGSSDGESNDDSSSNSDGDSDSDDDDENSDAPPKKKAKKQAAAKVGGGTKATPKPAAASCALDEHSAARDQSMVHTPTPKKPRGRAVSVAESTGNGSTVKKSSKSANLAEQLSGHMKTIQELSDTLEQIPPKFSTGGFDETTGRALQRLLGEWTAKKRSGTPAMNQLQKHGDDEECRRVLARFRSASGCIDPIASFLRTFNQPGQAKATFQTMLSEWTTVKNLISPPPQAATVLVQKMYREKIDEVPTPILDILNIMSPNPDPDAVTTHMIRAGDRPAVHKDLFVGLVGKIFKRRPFDNKRDPEKAMEIKTEIESEMTVLRGKMNEASFANLIGQIAPTIWHVLAVVHYAEESDDQVKNALTAWADGKQDAILVQAASSKAGAAFLRDAAEHLQGLARGREEPRRRGRMEGKPGEGGRGWEDEEGLAH